MLESFTVTSGRNDDRGRLLPANKGQAVSEGAPAKKSQTSAEVRQGAELKRERQASGGSNPISKRREEVRTGTLSADLLVHH